jgi:hypothetical protein
VTDIYLRPGNILHLFSRLYPDAWKQVDEFRARRKELGDWPDWCSNSRFAIFALKTRLF